jgi:predicted RNA-binding protein with RPS1 domain
MVKVLDIDRQGKIRLSRKEALADNGSSGSSDSPGIGSVDSPHK